MKIKTTGWPRFWQKATWQSQLLQPIAWAYGWLAERRARSTDVPSGRCSVVVVGNIVVGGSGKTLFLSWLISQCQRLGIKVGVVSRGYGGRARAPCFVEPDSDPHWVGDEPLLLRQLDVPVVVAQQRSAALDALLSDHPHLDLVLSDDGLQHYAMPRDMEICMFDGQQSIGNGRLLPAGPLREPLARLNSVDWIICKSEIPTELLPWQPLLMKIKPMTLKALPNSLADPNQPPTNQQEVVAICGIGQPESFFKLLIQHGWTLIPIALADHAHMTQALHDSLRGHTVLMTSKDAIKCRNVQLPYVAWEVPVMADFSVPDQQRILQSMLALIATEKASTP